MGTHGTHSLRTNAMTEQLSKAKNVKTLNKNFKLFFNLTIKQKMNIKDLKSTACDPFCSETWWFQQVDAPSQRR